MPAMATAAAAGRTSKRKHVWLAVYGWKGIACGVEKSIKVLLLRVPMVVRSVGQGALVSKEGKQWNFAMPFIIHAPATLA